MPRRALLFPRPSQFGMHQSASERISPLAMRSPYAWQLGQLRPRVQAARRNLWVWLLPVLFLPRLGLARTTSVGELQFSDLAIIPYFVIIWWETSHKLRRPLIEVLPTLPIFFLWASICTLTIPFRYDYADNAKFLFCTAKLAKLFLYGYVGWQSATRLATERAIRAFHWSLLAVLMVLGTTEIAIRPESSYMLALKWGYQSDMDASIQIAIGASYVGGLLVSGYGTQKWRRLAIGAIVVGVMGALVSGGRGGWVALACAGLFILVRGRRISARVLLVAVLASVFCLSYLYLEDFGNKLDRTVKPDPVALAIDGGGFGGIDDGQRYGIFLLNVPKLADEPVFGSGLFHREGATRLSQYGSHNFYMQMFLETGWLGGVLALAVFCNIWKVSGSGVVKAARFSTPLKAGLIAAFVGGMSSECFYGGTTLFLLLILTGPALAISAIRSGARR